MKTDGRGRVGAQVDSVDGMEARFVQVQGKSRDAVAAAGRALGLEGTYIPKSYIEQARRFCSTRMCAGQNTCVVPKSTSQCVGACLHGTVALLLLLVCGRTPTARTSMLLTQLYIIRLYGTTVSVFHRVSVRALPEARAHGGAQVQLEKLTASFQNVSEDLRRRFVVDGEPLLDSDSIGSSPVLASSLRRTTGFAVTTPRAASMASSGTPAVC